MNKLLKKLKVLRESEGGFSPTDYFMVVALGSILSVGILRVSHFAASIERPKFVEFINGDLVAAKTLRWMHGNSEELFPLFTNNEFEKKFELKNKIEALNTGNHQISSKVYLKGTQDAAILSNSAEFGSSSISELEESFFKFINKEKFYPETAKVRLSIVEAEKHLDFYKPTFQIDIWTKDDSAINSFRISAEVSAEKKPGFLAKAKMTLPKENNCRSFKMNHNGLFWSNGRLEENCLLEESNSEEAIKTVPKEELYELSSNCDNEISGLEDTHRLRHGGCWDSVNLNAPLVLSDYKKSYYFKNLSFDSDKARLTFAPVKKTDKYRVFIENFSNPQVNGRQLSALFPVAAQQLEIFYLGQQDLELVGEHDFHAAIFAPYAKIKLSGDFKFIGAIQAKNLDVGENVHLTYIENIDTKLADKFKFAFKRSI